MTVGVDAAAVETALRGGALRCPAPGCGVGLRPWGWARRRWVRGLNALDGRDGRGGVLRPRRGRCPGCGRTQVLLPASVLLRRADAVAVIGVALLGKATGRGHRDLAAELGRPVSTVRGWLRRLARVGRRVLAVLAATAAELGAEFVAPAPAGAGGEIDAATGPDTGPDIGPNAAAAVDADPVAAVVEMLGALARAVGRRLGGSCPPWRLAAVVTGGRLLAPAGPDLPVLSTVPPPGASAGPNTSWPWAGGP